MFPSIGQVVFMYVEHNQDGQLTEYKTRLVDETETELFFDFPINVKTNEQSYVGVGRNMRIEYVVKNGTRFITNAVVTRHLKRNTPLMVIPKPSLDSIQQIQRRNYFRIETDVDIAILKSDQTRVVCRTEDIGGGGISFIAGPNMKFEKGEALDCWLVLPFKNNTVEHANFKSEVVRVKEENSGLVIIMLKYLDILEVERQRIIRYSFAKQIELKEKGIIS